MKRYQPVGWILPGLMEDKNGTYVLYKDVLKEIRNFINELGWKTHQATDNQIKKYFGGEEREMEE